MADETFLVTGSLGCIGAWVLRNLVAEGVRVVATDVAADPVRPRLLMNDEEIGRIRFETLDVTDLERVKELVARHAVTHIVHLAGLQVPFCKANPALGARVNVVGTVNIFEAARAHWGQVRGLAYASSLAVMGPDHLYPEKPVRDDAPLHPQSLYGVYKQANEETARIYWQDWGIPSAGLRPCIVYGVARDQGMTSDIAKAMLAVAAGKPYHIRFGGPVTLQYADDVARLFIACARSGYQGAAACNMRNDVTEVERFATLLNDGYAGSRITCAETPLPFPADLDDSKLRSIVGGVPHTPLAQAVEESVGLFRRLLDEGRVDLSQLDA
jgi:nucleoside-diphosphate-sugar epimerase